MIAPRVALAPRTPVTLQSASWVGIPTPWEAVYSCSVLWYIGNMYQIMWYEHHQYNKNTFNILRLGKKKWNTTTAVLLILHSISAATTTPVFLVSRVYYIKSYHVLSADATHIIAAVLRPVSHGPFLRRCWLRYLMTGIYNWNYNYSLTYFHHPYSCKTLLRGTIVNRTKYCW